MKTPEEIGNLSLTQFNELIYHLGRRINWEVQVSAISGGNKLDDKYHPLSPDISAHRDRDGGVSNASQGQQVESLEAFEQRLREFVRK